MLKKVIRFFVIFSFVLSIFSFQDLTQVNAASASNSWMTVVANNNTTHGYGSVACDPIYYGTITLEIYYSSGFQEYYKSGSSSALSGTYISVYPNFGSVLRAKGTGKLSNGQSLSTAWDY